MYHIVMFVHQNLKMMLFSHVLVIFTVIQNKRLATNNRNAILNNFEEYYKFRWGNLIMSFVGRLMISLIQQSVLWVRCKNSSVDHCSYLF